MEGLSPGRPAYRRVCVVTTGRADYGPLYPLLHELRQAPGIDLRIVVSGAHLSSRFGKTWTIVQDDGFHIAAMVDMLLAEDDPVALTKSMGVGLIGLASALDAIRPDLIVVLGDRYEIMLVAQSALLRNTPLAHIAGGEITEGAFDDSIRHAITKFAHLHFVATEQFRQRVIQLGEDPGRVWTVGALGLDALRCRTLLRRADVETRLGYRLTYPTLLATYHPATRGGAPADAAEELVQALDAFPNATVVFTDVNADPGGQAVADIINAWAGPRANRVHVHKTLGSTLYLSVLSLADAVVGNSSSAIIEAPAVRTPTVDLGERQHGRPKADSVIWCPEDRTAIREAIIKALSDEHRRRTSTAESPYGDGYAAPRITNTLSTVDLGSLRVKRFHDLYRDPADHPERPRTDVEYT
jgi:UDP-N-acetylglucosamine 2-epimerase (non-hydrolysing)